MSGEATEMLMGDGQDLCRVIQASDNEAFQYCRACCVGAPLAHWRDMARDCRMGTPARAGGRLR